MIFSPQKLSVAITLSLTAGIAMATNLSDVYQQALAHDATYQAAAKTYAAAKQSLPIARAALLPSITASAEIDHHNDNPVDPGNKKRYQSQSYELDLSQPLFNLYNWRIYNQSDLQVKQAALTYEQAKQNLIISVATAYFAVLEAQDKLRYAKTYQSQLNQQLLQTKQQYKVGLKALTDVQSTRASYESAVADTISAQNDVNNAYENLSAITGRQEKDLTPLKTNAPLLKPDPTNIDDWTKTADKQNLDLLLAAAQVSIDRAGIAVAAAGNGTINGYYPTVTVDGQFTRSGSNQSGSTTLGNTSQLGVNLSYNLYNGGITNASVKQAKDTFAADKYNLEQAKRNTASQTKQAYLTVLSDISQVQALKQAVISGESSLKAVLAGYQVGTRTIVDLLTQQSNLFNDQQQYAQARYAYITDGLNLKKAAGTLSEKDITAINTWLNSKNSKTKKT